MKALVMKQRSILRCNCHQDAEDEMSGEFGDNVSVCSRRKSVAVTDEDHVSLENRGVKNI